MLPTTEQIIIYFDEIKFQHIEKVCILSRMHSNDFSEKDL